MAELGIAPLRRSDRPRRPARGRRGGRPLEGARDRPLEPARMAPDVPAGTPLRRTRAQDSPLPGALDWELIELAEAGDRGRHAGRAPSCRSGTSTARSAACSRTRSRVARGAEGLPRRDDPLHAARLGGPVVRRVARAGRRADALRRRERLHRQGPLRRHDRDPAARGRDVRGRGERDRRQHRPLRRDEGQGVLPRPRGRALRRAQLGRGRRRRGRRRPRLRVHDRRPRRRARPHRAQLRGRDERRHRLRPRRGRRLRGPLQPRARRPRPARGRRRRARCARSSRSTPSAPARRSPRACSPSGTSCCRASSR